MARLEKRPCRHGTGVITLSEICKGEIILEFTGPVLSRGELPLPLVPEGDLFLQIGEDLFLSPSGEIDDYINHSCSPNCGVVVGPFTTARLVALRTIHPGESVVFDYSTTMDNAPCIMDCSCGSPDCRSWITDFLGLPQTLQRAYLEM
ncbi:MAG: SET domain-containing protein [Planctomycetota bacterium]|jgi:SET domain-containing protein